MFDEEDLKGLQNLMKLMNKSKFVELSGPEVMLLAQSIKTLGKVNKLIAASLEEQDNADK